MLKNNISIAEDKEVGFKTKCIGIGTERIKEVQETNIAGVVEAIAIYKECSNRLREYKILLDADASHIKTLGVNFFEFDKHVSHKIQGN